MFSNAKQNIPPLFQEIIDIDNRIKREKAKPVLDFDTLTDLKSRRFELSKAAEKFIQTKRKEST